MERGLPLTRRGRAVRPGAALTLTVLTGLLVGAVVLAVGSGAVRISPAQVLSILLAPLGAGPLTPFDEQQAAVLWVIRLPRVLLGALVGAGLAVAGAALQGLFRNPLADPGLMGITSGAALAAALSVVLGLHALGTYSLPAAAFAGSLISTALVSLLAQDRGRVNVTTMLLAGIAINALCGAGTGLMTFLATDEQLRTITFWNLGSLGGATWPTVLSALPLILLGAFGLPLTARALNALTLGEHGAAHLGVPVTRVKWLIITLVALSVGAGVAVAGSIGFIGLVVPHLLRLLTGPNHATLLPASALLGATLLILADLLARTVAAPAEVPIGILTALLGAPFFLYLLRQTRRAESA
ncbi:iron ABC transporter permease [Deinococcus soli (ex Cha et al. 2016)]|uniref:Iron complex transport system permease protein n=2 Tax=Deinococcus soli (ex Cha et al. 2016) TaxID=1309411 RepID=A0AAE3XBG3_9DEIO|nr:iron ABC transporter permease [Deinococcus soli (ex Cha et al. 2016)]MDR6217981.1 iron complex transport system permease protein [Deinococcus soli (ex Cha et al. 2016)]MDR6328231.1 iron complex transport system permease protein [Deinococcus soli (ex Cha et al. 2016)]MDR6751083.1 iron complex transport system permease protein [Deinococcus soli (ex Cha et al. 2016)]GGB55407.1 ABC transporter permease [Deinococcus soli (ex Cha et al. 2016)]